MLQARSAGDNPLVSALGRSCRALEIQISDGDMARIDAWVPPGTSAL